mgnify:FL=1
MDTLSVTAEWGDYADPQVQMDTAETKRLLDEIIGELPESQRLCILLWKEQLSTAEIASALDMPKGTVNSNVNYAKKKIKDKVLLLEKQGTKLYGLAPVPFFLWLLSQFETGGYIVPASIDAASIQKILDAVSHSSSAGTAGGSAAAEGTAAGAGSGSGMTGAASAGGLTVGKIAAIAAAALVVIGGGGVLIHNSLNTDAPAQTEQSPDETSNKIIRNNDENTLSEETANSEEAPQLSEEANAAARNAYAEALTRLINTYELPDGSGTIALSMEGDLTGHQFGIADVDNDSLEELVLTTSGASMADARTYVYGYDGTTIYQQTDHPWPLSGLYFLGDQGIVTGVSHAYGAYEIFQPYEVLTYSEADDSYVPAGTAACYQAPGMSEDPYASDFYNAEVDVDGNGLIYVVSRYDEELMDDPVSMDDADYNAWCEDMLGTVLPQGLKSQEFDFLVSEQPIPVEYHDITPKEVNLLLPGSETESENIATDITDEQKQRLQLLMESIAVLSYSGSASYDQNNPDDFWGMVSAGINQSYAYDWPLEEGIGTWDMSGIYLSGSEVSAFAEAMFADVDALPEVPAGSPWVQYDPASDLYCIIPVDLPYVILDNFNWSTDGAGNYQVSAQLIPGESESSGNVLAEYTFTVAANPEDEASWFGASIHEVNGDAP